ncbi:MAG TPA: S41 family peptidase [Thermoanaerobaculaceae bacterium]|nr:S41 family peptidase [Thermoanaerobaculaceae bacterium]
MKPLRRVLVALAVVAAGAIAGAIAGDTSRSDFARSDGFIQRYASLYRLVLDNAPQKADPADLVYSSIDGMLALLDPHTSFLRPDAYAHMKEKQQGAFHGIGVIISIRGGRITVITPIEGTPAAKVGLRAGDIIETVDGVSTEGMDISDAAARLRGPEGSSVRLTVMRPGLATALDLTIRRARVPTDSVRYAFMIGSDTAYIRISDFIRSTGDEVKETLERLQKAGANRLLLDLRDNPGGLVDTAVAVSAMLLEPGEEVFSTKGRTADSFQDYRASHDGLHFQGPVVVLINRGSASAAEIVAGAIQDHDRGIIVGETSFGKGVVQTIYPVRDAGLALTTAKYYTPSGRCIQRDFDSFFEYVHPQEAPEATPPAGATPTPNAARPVPGGTSPVYYTDSGRKVFGGGGITPDHEVHLGEYSERLVRLIANSAFFHNAVTYLADKPDKAAAASAYVVTPEVLKAFRDRVVTEKWLPAAHIDAALADPVDRREIEIGLRAEVLNSAVSLTEGYRVLLESDEQVQAGLKYFDEAAKLQVRAHLGKTSPAKTAARTAVDPRS